MIWLSVPEAAKLVHVPERAIRRAVAVSALPAVRPSERKTRVWYDDLCKWLATRRSQDA